ncbi:MAG: citrate/2-methylcitrate synthase [Sandaracinaceae bacterium]
MDQASAKSDPGWLDAAEASALLGVKRATLYAYASRGLVRRRAKVGERGVAYAEEDLRKLLANSRARAGHGAVAAGALRWGEPVLDSSITEVRADGPAYRGRAAVSLADEGASYEAVADRLIGIEGGADAWREPLPGATVKHASTVRAALTGGTRARATELRPLDAALVWLSAQAAHDPARFDLGEAQTHALARRIIRGVACSFGLLADPRRTRDAARAPTIARAFAISFALPRRAEALRAIEAALILCADHELNVSSFASRVAASAGADLYACAIAALATLTGAKHGGASARVAALIDEIGAPERATRAVRDRLRRGEPIAGFGHPLYPDGDPRARPLLERARSLAPRANAIRVLDALVDAMELVGAEPPNVDVGLCAVAAALGLPPGGAGALFATGRAAGWIAHAIEQRAENYLLRPRARFRTG